MVGGHCIGVDPYYLTYKAKKIGYDLNKKQLDKVYEAFLNFADTNKSVNDTDIPNIIKLSKI